MSVQAMTYVIENSRAKGSELLVLLLIANHAGSDEWIAWPSAATLGRETRMSERQVRRIIKRLEDIGELTVRRRSGTSPKYLLTRGDILSGGTDRTPDTATSATPDTATSAEPSRTVTTTSLQESTKPRDLAFDRLAQETGHDLETLTPSAAATLGTKLAELRLAEAHRQGTEVVDVEAFAGEIAYRAERYRRLHPTWDLTPGSLAKWWSTLGRRDMRPTPEQEAVSETVGTEPPWTALGMTYQRWLREGKPAPEVVAS